ncbi:MAG: MBL fold metallo-hydrolase [Defluviitaleaceae bacterium]|nr:MBL fold metallo-hydrolase [Defluviitaleaceae bacterium]
MKVLHMPVAPYYTNSYIYYDENTLEAAVIDPGGSADKLMDTAKENGLTIKYILLTHGHFDHIAGANELKVLSGAQVIAFEDEDELLKSADMNLSLIGMGKGVIINSDKLLKEGDFVDVGNGKLALIHTPGHTAGGVCYYDEENGILFSGDTLFKGTTGRYDLPTSDGAALFASIKKKLFTLPDDVKVLPGHEASTTIGFEKANNRVAADGL